jgi:hypothetical protein
MKQWQVLFIEKDDLQLLEKACDEYGKDDWEPVNFAQKLRESTIDGTLRVSGWVAMLKRPL